MTDVDVAVAGNSELGESPLWDPDTRCLWWTDILRGAVLRHNPSDGSVREYLVGDTVGALGLHRLGSLLLAAGDGFRLLNTHTGTTALLAAVEQQLPNQRMNDGKVDPAGRFWAGTISMSGEPGAGSLYRLDANGEVSTVVSGLTVSNGPAWSPDGCWMYHTDSPTKTIRRYAFDNETGEIGRNPSILVDTSAHAGIPDGMTVDAEGGIWVCFWGGSSIRRYDPAGRILAEIHLPVTNPTSCCFGGSSLADLFITSACYGLSPDQICSQPAAGSILRLETGVIGIPSVRSALA